MTTFAEAPTLPSAHLISPESQSAKIEPIYMMADKDPTNPFGHVRGLGDVACIRSEMVCYDMEGTFREQLEWMVELDGITHVVRETRPDNDQPATVTTLHLLGFTEQLQVGSGHALHNALAAAAPTEHVITLATEGVTGGLTKFGWRDGLRQDFRRVADHSQRLLFALTEGETPVNGRAVSMGAKLLVMLAAANATKPAAEQVQLEQLILHSPCVVGPSHVPVDVALRFLPHIALDALREATNGHAEDIAGYLSAMPSLGAQLPGLVGNLKNILQGIPCRTSMSVAQDHQVGIVYGTRDPLAQITAWQKVKERFPRNVELLPRPGKGHALSIAAHQTVTDFNTVSNALTERKSMFFHCCMNTNRLLARRHSIAKTLI